MCFDTQKLLEKAGLCSRAAELILQCAKLARQVTALEEKLATMRRPPKTPNPRDREVLSLIAELCLTNGGNPVRNVEVSRAWMERTGRNLDARIFPRLRHPDLERVDLPPRGPKPREDPKGNWDGRAALIDQEACWRILAGEG